MDNKIRRLCSKPGCHNLTADTYCSLHKMCIRDRVDRERDKRPKLSDLRDSGCVEQDADIILLLYRDEYYFPHTQDKGIVEMAVAKCRDGSPGMAKLSWQPQIMRVMDSAEVKRLKKQAEEFRLKKYGEQETIEKKAEQAGETKEAKEA